MATKIIHKKSSTASSVPAAASLEPGEIAVNLADKKLYTKTTGGTVIELADGDKLAGIEAGATADQTAAEILTAIKTVDGSGSGLDADLLDGVHASSFLRSDTSDTASGTITFNNGINSANGSFLTSSNYLQNFIKDTRYQPGGFTLDEFRSNAIWNALERGYTQAISDDTGVTNLQQVWYPDTTDHYATFDMSQTAANLDIDLLGTFPVTTNVGAIRIYAVWHGSAAYNTVSFQVKRNDDVWVDVPQDTTHSTSIMAVSEPLNSYAAYPTYTAWKGIRLRMSNKATTSGNRYLYGIALYAPRDFAYPYLVYKKGDTFYGTMATEALLPRTSATYDLGSTSSKYRNAYFSGDIEVDGTVDGRDVASDGTKLDGIEAGADVTDFTNVQAAGALMDSEVTNLADVKSFDPADYAAAGHNHTLDGLSNTTITSNTSGEILKWNGTAWVNNTLAEAGIQPAGSYLTGNQTITLSGDLSGSGTTSINAQIESNAVGANELNVTGNGTAGQYLASDGDGTFSWVTGGGGDAGTLDGIDSSQFLRSDVADTKTSGNLGFSDNVKATFGASDDLQVYHDGSNSYVSDNGTGELVLKGSSISMQNANGTGLISFDEWGAGSWKYEGSNAISVGSSGTTIDWGNLQVNGNIGVTGTVDGRDIAQNIPSSLGTAGQVLQVNSGATATEWATASKSLELLEVWTPTAVSSKIFTWDETKYLGIRLVICGINGDGGQTSTSVDGYMGHSNGTVFAGSQYEYAYYRDDNGTMSSNNEVAYIPLIASDFFDNVGADNGLHGTIDVMTPASNDSNYADFGVISNLICSDNTAINCTKTFAMIGPSAGASTSTTTYDSFKIQLLSGSFNAGIGEVYVYGYPR